MHDDAREDEASSAIHEAEAVDEEHAAAEMSEDEAAAVAQHVAEAQVEEEAREAQRREFAGERSSRVTSPITRKTLANISDAKQLEDEAEEPKPSDASDEADEPSIRMKPRSREAKSKNPPSASEGHGAPSRNRLEGEHAVRARTLEQSARSTRSSATAALESARPRRFSRAHAESAPRWTVTADVATIADAGRNMATAATDMGIMATARSLTGRN